ncbi:hypothetical protein F3Y22_tig00112289pilonHSYRG00294 [Hibiscus syriacus]|uniref:RNase H type-1 domain-containing protein n=1 Tax=Hibiscus syriacus TaxID=106335 RepID=A0A6A2XP34_HIBSY|nr:hypothetical protein F3Y22_tig00112289pilonHSYRG00294 [Hibiscus syriacus]
MKVDYSRKILPAEFYPSWVVFSQRLKLTWLNQHLTKICPYVNESTIRDAIEDSIMWPVRKIIPILPGDYSDLELKPVGILEVKLIQAREAPELIGCAQVLLSELEPGKVKDVWLNLVKDLEIQRDTRVRLASWFLAKHKDVSIPKNSLIFDPSIGDSYSPYNFLKSSIIPWLSPRMGFIKLNVDATTSSDWKKSGLGGLLREHSSAILGSFQEPVGSGPPTLKELKAITRGISFFASFQGRVKDRLIVESDNRVTVDWINNVDSCPVFGFLVPVRMGPSNLIKKNCDACSRVFSLRRM